MGILLSFGEDGKAIGFGTIVPLIEHGQRKYGEAWLEHGCLVLGKTNDTVQKLASWVSHQSPSYKYDIVPLDELSLEELDFLYRLMCDFREEGTSIDGNSYDSPITEVNIKQLDEVIPATKIYIEARKNGIEKQDQN